MAAIRKWNIYFVVGVALAIGVQAEALSTSAEDRLFEAEITRVKSLKDPEKTLERWNEEGFAYPERRASEFESLRLDKVEGGWRQPPRIHRRDTTPDDFREKYEADSQTVVIEGIPEMAGWKAADWSLESVARDYPDMLVTVGSVYNEDGGAGPQLKLTMKEFERYARTNTDDNPLYVFDHAIYEDEKFGKEFMSQYDVPDLFPDDLFSVLDKHEGYYPGYRWLLIGPKRSGSSVHFDPLATAAWNTLISGRKLWFLSPPELNDHFERKEPSHGNPLIWFVDVLPKLREEHRDKIYMYVQHPGETMFVPPYWSHAVLNLDDTVAVTQNFVSRTNFADAWEQTKFDLPSFAARWLEALADTFPKLALEAVRLGIRELQTSEDDDEDSYDSEDDDDELGWDSADEMDDDYTDDEL